MNLKEIKDLIELVSDKGFAEFEIKRQGFRLRIRRFAEAPPQVIHPAPTPVIGIPTTATQLISSGGQRALIEAPTASAAPGTRPAAEVAEEAKAEPKAELHLIKSLIIGTFYRASSPQSDPFVRIGSQVEPDTVVCIIEAMKLMNEIQAETSGEIVEIYVENGQPVEYGQKLFGVKAQD